MAVQCLCVSLHCYWFVTAEILVHQNSVLGVPLQCSWCTTAEILVYHGSVGVYHSSVCVDHSSVGVYQCGVYHVRPCHCSAPLLCVWPLCRGTAVFVALGNLGEGMQVG